MQAVNMANISKNKEFFSVNYSLIINEYIQSTP